MAGLPRSVRCLLTLAILTAVLPALAADWPGWLGPDLNGRSPEAGSFQAESFALDVAWSRPLGIAYSGIAVVGDRAVSRLEERRVTLTTGGAGRKEEGKKS